MCPWKIWCILNQIFIIVKSQNVFQRNSSPMWHLLKNIERMSLNREICFVGRYPGIHLLHKGGRVFVWKATSSLPQDLSFSGNGEGSGSSLLKTQVYLREWRNTLHLQSGGSREPNNRHEISAPNLLNLRGWPPHLGGLKQSWNVRQQIRSPQKKSSVP